MKNVTRFVGSGEEEAAETELHNLQLAVTSMMLENGITTIPGAVATPETNSMIAFPDNQTTVAARDTLEGLPTGHLSQIGYVLFDHQLAFDSDGDGIIEPVGATGDTPKQVNYVVQSTTTYSYVCAADGTVSRYVAP